MRVVAMDQSSFLYAADVPNLRIEKHAMKTTSAIFSLFALPGLCLVSCEKPGAKYELSREQALAQVEAAGGKTVSISGDAGPYRLAYRYYCNAGKHQPGDRDGTSRGRYAVSFGVEEDYYHVIHVYDNATGGALLVSTRHPAITAKTRPPHEPQEESH